MGVGGVLVGRVVMTVVVSDCCRDCSSGSGCCSCFEITVAVVSHEFVVELMTVLGRESSSSSLRSVSPVLGCINPHTIAVWVAWVVRLSGDFYDGI